MKTDSILRIATVIFACLSVIMGGYIVMDRVTNPEPAAVVDGMGEDDHAGDDDHTTAGDDDHADEVADTVAADAGMGDESHQHAEGAAGVEVSGWDAIPTISLEVIEDGHGGYVALASINNFTFKPENVDTPAAIGEGHGHIYINGEKISRIYSNAYWIGELAPGEYTISVTLNANDHQDLTLNGEVLSAEYALTVPE